MNQNLLLVLLCASENVNPVDALAGKLCNSFVALPLAHLPRHISHHVRRVGASGNLHVAGAAVQVNPLEGLNLHHISGRRGRHTESPHFHHSYLYGAQGQSPAFHPQTEFTSVEENRQFQACAGTDLFIPLSPNLKACFQVSRLAA